MLLEGSCHCEAVRFRVESPEPYPFMYCYCSICRKTAGSGGYAINLGALSDTLEVQDEENVSVYQARIDGELSLAQRHFCGTCGSALWVFDPNWPDLVHPFVSAVDTPSRSLRKRHASCSTTPRRGARSPQVLTKNTSPSSQTNHWKNGTRGTVSARSRKTAETSTLSTGCGLCLAAQGKVVLRRRKHSRGGIRMEAVR
jgi:hypothetical protein